MSAVTQEQFSKAWDDLLGFALNVADIAPRAATIAYVRKFGALPVAEAPVEDVLAIFAAHPALDND